MNTPSSTRAASLIKPYLRKLVLQTHPDFFQRDPIKAKHNAASLQQLYTILNPILQQQDNRSKSKRGNEAGHDDTSIPVAFYPKHASNAASRVSISFDPRPISAWHTAASVLDLCRQLDIKVATSDDQAVHQMISKEMASSSERSSYKSLREQFVRALYQQHQQQQQQPQQQKVKHWTMQEIFNNRHLMFAPSVDKKVMASRLAQWLGELHPEKWWGQLPVLVLPATAAASLSPDRAKGILVLTSEMDLEGNLYNHVYKKRTAYIYFFILLLEMKCYLEQHVAVKKREYQEMGKKSSSSKP